MAFISMTILCGQERALSSASTNAKGALALALTWQVVVGTKMLDFHNLMKRPTIQQLSTLRKENWQLESEKGDFQRLFISFSRCPF